MTSRYIKQKVSIEVRKRHFFECAWCGTKLTERHHIKEYSAGGEHIEENLILLCPNCHTEVHKKDRNIKFTDLLERKSTHMKGDRIAGSLQFDVTQSKIKMAEIFFQNFANFLSFGGENVISLEKSNGEYFLNCRFFNKNGHLIFWMSKNRYWAPSIFKLSLGNKSIEIENSVDSFQKLKVWQIDDYLCLQGTNYCKGNKISIDSYKTKIGSIVFSGRETIMGNGTNSLFNM